MGGPPPFQTNSARLRPRPAGSHPSPLQIRDGPGPEGLRLFHSDAGAGPGQALICAPLLSEELACGRWRVAVFRRLHRRLSADQEALLREFALLNVGSVIDEDPRPCSVLMAPAAAAAVECLSCSDIVAMALHLVGLVEPNAAAGEGEYVAADRRGRLVGPPLALRLRSQAGGERGSPGGSPTATASARSSFGEPAPLPATAAAATPVAG